jgi:hypothetical protein
MITLTPISSKRKVLTATSDLIGKYINRVLWSDVDPVAKIIGIQGKNTLVCCKVTASENLTPHGEMGFEAGGFVGHYHEQSKQQYHFTTHEYDVFNIRYSESMRKKKFLHINDYPRKFYDYNF